MRVLTIEDERFGDYKKCGMFIACVSCDFKCAKENGFDMTICQNYSWSKRHPILITNKAICERYMSNPISQCIIFGGLEPLLQKEEIFNFIKFFRDKYNKKDEIIIYTGYYLEEFQEFYNSLVDYGPIIFKTGRYIPNTNSRYDEILGIELSSANQKAILIKKKS